MNDTPEIPKELDAITVHVLNYRPPDKGVAIENTKNKMRDGGLAFEIKKRSRESSI